MTSTKASCYFLLLSLQLGLSNVLANGAVQDVSLIKENIAEIPHPTCDSDYEFNYIVRALKTAVEECDLIEAGKEFVIYQRERSSLEHIMDDLIKKTNVLIRTLRFGRNQYSDKTLLHWVKENLEHEKERSNNAGRRLTIEQNIEILWQVILDLLNAQY